MLIVETGPFKDTPLEDIIAAADATNHAIPTPKELSRAFTKLIQCEVVSAKDGAFFIFPGFLSAIQKAYEGKVGLFQAPEKGLKWLRKSGLSIKNDEKAEITGEEVRSAYQEYTKAIRKRRNA